MHQFLYDSEWLAFGDVMYDAVSDSLLQLYMHVSHQHISKETCEIQLRAKATTCNV